MPAKEVICRCHGLLALSPEYASPWEDVWISIKTRPGRRRLRFAPCLVARPTVESDLELTRKCQAEHPELDYSEEIAVYESAIERLHHAERFVSREWTMYEERMPNIYTRAARIDRAEAERMLDVYLAELGFLGPKKYRWKRPLIVAVPVAPY